MWRLWSASALHCLFFFLGLSRGLLSPSQVMNYPEAPNILRPATLCGVRCLSLEIALANTFNSSRAGCVRVDVLNLLQAKSNLAIGCPSLYDCRKISENQ
ncbi:MAG: hypothetical protein A2511_08775 [Deltaproteobacteria bacterium RIFOXYD12_FULL_50_9]|nr:MAG: hypothetical protein A2511_08775 [Deltaproteobacteria bacterium RIFOXYD12_FULL_50_9]